MRIDKEPLLAQIVATPLDRIALFELSDDAIVASRRFSSAWALAEHLQRTVPAPEVRALLVAAAERMAIAEPERLIDECLLDALILVSRDDEGLPDAAWLHLRHTTGLQVRRYPFFRMPDEFTPVPPDPRQAACLIFNGAATKPFIRETMKLARDAGLPAAMTLVMRRERFTAAALDALAERLTGPGDRFATVIFARDPGSRAVTELAARIGKRVMTREDLVVSIFEQRADGHSGKLKAAALSLERERVRYRERAHGLSRLTGGVGARGPGETVGEERRRLLKREERRIRRALGKERERRADQRKFRSRTDRPTVAIVGYTNAGKSTLFNALVGARAVRESAEFFSSIDPKIRLLTLFGRKFFLMDTVGFIEGMSQGVKGAFEPTFDEILHAALVIQVVDPADNEWRDRKGTVDRLLEEIGVGPERILTIYSKRDIAPPAPPGEVSYAAGDRRDIGALKRMLYGRLFGEGEGT